MPYKLEGKEKLEVEDVQKLLDKVLIPNGLQVKINVK